MHSSPITTWEGAAAYFTFADMPGVLYAILAAAIIVCFGTIVITVMHEDEAYKKVNGKE
jgi:hypothetical protein